MDHSANFDLSSDESLSNLFDGHSESSLPIPSHSWVKRPSNESTNNPKEICIQCMRDEKGSMYTDSICGVCDVGLCSQLCFDHFHANEDEIDLASTNPSTPVNQAEDIDPGNTEPSTSKQFKTKAQLKSFRTVEQLGHHSSESGSPSSPESNDTTTQPASIYNDLHLLVTKAPTKRKDYPQVKCHICSSRKDTRTLCSHCKVGLCGKTCFDKFHINLGFQLVPAARPQELHIPLTPQKRGPRPPGIRATESNSDVSPHKHVKKPPTPSKKNAQLRCSQCSHEGRGRKSTTFMCDECEKGLCSAKCFTSYHHRKQILNEEAGPSSIPTGSRRGVLRTREYSSDEQPPTHRRRRRRIVTKKTPQEAPQIEGSNSDKSE